MNWQDQAAERVAQWILRHPAWVWYAAFLFCVGCFASAAYLIGSIFSPQWAWIAAVVVAGAALLSLAVKVVVRLLKD